MTFLEPTGLTVSSLFLLKATNAGKIKKILQLKSYFLKKVLSKIVVFPTLSITSSLK
jgi:hypothetical protein